MRIGLRRGLGFTAPKLQVVGREARSRSPKADISEIRPFVEFAGAMPAPLQQHTNYDAVATNKTSAGAAAALIKMIASANSAEPWKAAGVEPAH